MNNPHVVSLRYILRTGDSVSYNAPPEISYSTDEFDATLASDFLTISFKCHHPTVGSAQEQVTPFIRSWEISTAIQFGLDALRFEFLDAEVIDQVPVQPGSRVLHAAIAAMGLSISGSATLRVILNSYPQPFPDFVASPLVELLFARYQSYKNGKDLLTTMGYSCLSAVQAQAGGRNNAARQYNIAVDVLDKLGRLTSDVGDDITARKFDNFSERRPHTAAEIEWIESAVKKLIFQVAKHNSGTVNLPQLTLSDLPTP